MPNKRETTALFFLALCLAPALSQRCPLSAGKTNGTCNASAVCAVFDGSSSTCVGWANYLCTRGQFRDLTTCMCVNCPSGTGSDCTPDRECCSLTACDRGYPPPSTTPKPKPWERPWALGGACQRAAHGVIGMLLAVTLAACLC